MTFDKFVGEVQHRAQLGSLGEAIAAIRATLQTLGEKLDPGEAKDLAAQLPREIGFYLDTRQHGLHMRLDDFFQMVSQRAEADLPDAVFHVRVVFEVLQEAVSAGEMADVRAQLPNEWAPLFEGSAGRMAAPTR